MSILDQIVESVRAAEAEARARVPMLLHTLSSAGFRQRLLLKRYPGVDVN